MNNSGDDLFSDPLGATDNNVDLLALAKEAARASRRNIRIYTFDLSRIFLWVFLPLLCLGGIFLGMFLQAKFEFFEIMEEKNVISTSPPPVQEEKEGGLESIIEKYKKYGRN